MEDRDHPLLPAFNYYLDESDPDILILRRQDGFFVAAFSARGATKEGIIEAAEEDYRALLKEHAGSLGLCRARGARVTNTRGAAEGKRREGP